MEKILIISDNHGKLDRLQRIVEETGPYDLMLHCGDGELPPEAYEEIVPCPMRVVRGNCDSFDFPITDVFELKGHRILMTHGHMQYVKFGMDNLLMEAQFQKADIVLFGHTHIQYLENKNGLWLVNPGSLTYPKRTGPTYAVMTFSGNRPNIQMRSFL